MNKWLKLDWIWGENESVMLLVLKPSTQLAETTGFQPQAPFRSAWKWCRKALMPVVQFWNWVLKLFAWEQCPDFQPLLARHGFKPGSSDSPVLSLCVAYSILESFLNSVCCLVRMRATGAECPKALLRGPSEQWDLVFSRMATGHRAVSPQLPLLTCAVLHSSIPYQTVSRSVCAAHTWL